jgi:hypothetical protein
MRQQNVVALQRASATRCEAGLKHLERSTQDRWQPISIHLNRSEKGLSLHYAYLDTQGEEEPTW